MTINDYLLQKGRISFRGDEKAFRTGINFIYDLMNKKKDVQITLISGNSNNDCTQQYSFNNAFGSEIVEELGYETNEEKFEYIMNFLYEFYLIDYINIRVTFNHIPTENYSYKNEPCYSVLIMTNNFC